jgi:hypothetical protein
MLATKVWWLALLAAIVYWLYYRRIIATEEAFLWPRFGAEFENWAARTPAILPNIAGWRAPDLPFSWRTVLRREYVTAYSIVVIMTGIAIADELIAERGSLSAWVDEEPFWLWFFAIGTVAFLTLRAVKKRTDWLSVAGR